VILRNGEVLRCNPKTEISPFQKKRNTRRGKQKKKIRIRKVFLGTYEYKCLFLRVELKK
jgi:hypothetical protein